MEIIKYYTLPQSRWHSSPQEANTRPSTLLNPAPHLVSAPRQCWAPCPSLRSSYIYTVLKLHLPFEGYREADVAPGEYEFDTPALVFNIYFFFPFRLWEESFPSFSFYLLPSLKSSSFWTFVFPPKHKKIVSFESCWPLQLRSSVQQLGITWELGSNANSGTPTPDLLWRGPSSKCFSKLCRWSWCTQELEKVLWGPQKWSERGERV